MANSKQKTNIGQIRGNDHVSLETIFEILDKLGLNLVTRKFQDEKVDIKMVISVRREFDKQGRIEATSSVALEVLIIKSEIDFINLFIFNCLTSNINLFFFNCLTSSFCFSEEHIFRKQKRTDYFAIKIALSAGRFFFLVVHGQTWKD